MASLEALLEARVAVPLDVSAGSVLVGSNLTGTMQLYRVSGGGELEPLTAEAEPVVGAYVPGSERVLVQMDDAGNERLQLYLLELGGALEPLVVEPDFIHRSPALSRDGRLVAYACNRRNGTDFDIYVRELESGEERSVFAPGGWCDVAGFSPDGRLVAVSRLTEKSGDNELHLVEVATGQAIEILPHDGDAYLGEPAWLPDGSAFFVSSSVGRDTAAIVRFELESGGSQVVVEAPWDLIPVVDPTGRTLLVHWNEDGYSRLELRDPVTCEVTGEVPLPGRGVVQRSVFSPDGRSLGFDFTSPLEPGDVWLWDGTESRRLTESPGRFRPDELVEPRLERFDSFDGESVPVYVYERDPEAPVVIMIHGGPEAQLRPIWNPIAQYFAGAGYRVAAPNVRGSTGYGKRYEHLDDVELRLDSVRDLCGLHEWLGEPQAVLYGGSYGGYMVLAGLAFHPERWAAGIEIVGISSLVSFLENTSAWRRAFREREYGSLERDRAFLESVSPIGRVEEIRAPLFVIHGANDPRVPVGEARQIHAALTGRGVPCELLIYEDEGHGLQKLQNRLDAFPRAVAFLERVVGPS